MLKQSLKDGAETFDVTVLKAPEPFCLVLFAVGGGGDPGRHLSLLMYLAERGCTIVAPHFERLGPTNVCEGDLLLRARRLSLAVDAFARPGLLVAGVGHSIGTTMLLALAGGQARMRAGQCLPIATDKRLGKLALMAPATQFFQASGALDGVATPILAWAGTHDTVTPPAQAQLLKQSLGTRVPVEVRIVQGAGHFSFMNNPPPSTIESLPNREAFLAELALEMCQFVSD
jgi:pimeloyl-ACP methyl ester carboxylesterase